MAKSPPAPQDAPVLDQEVVLPGEGEAAPAKRFRLRLPALAWRLPKLPFRLRVPMSKKLLIMIGAGTLALSAVGAAAYAFWPAEPNYPRTPVAKKKPKHPKSAASAAQGVSRAASVAVRASEPAPLSAAASAPSADAASAPRAAASGPEEPMDRLRRRLGETLAGGSKLEAAGPGELRLTARVAAEKPAPRAAERSAERQPAERGARLRGEPAAFEDAAAPRLARPSAAALAHADWSYDGAGGPDAWGRLKPEFAKCSSGLRQSPIDLRDGIQVELDPVQFSYQPSRFRVIDNGHTVQVNVAPGNFIEVNGRRYELQQFHFHRPSEERIDGKQFDMAVHLVHKDLEGRLAFVAVLLQRGAAQSVVQQVWNNLPLEKGEEQAAQSPIALDKLLPAERGYYTYMGSLTTPPCSEGVLWMVMKTPVQVAPEQIGIFARLYPMNARPLQSASGRIVKESN
jgi:carbonic anhydrase